MFRDLACTWLLLAASVASAAPPSAKAGFGKVNITPQQSLWMSGYAARTAPAEGKETDLWAKALFLQDANQRPLLLITLDLVGITRELSQQLCQTLQQKYRLPREAIAIATSHTHCGPVVSNNLRSAYFLNDEQNRRVEAYTKQLAEWIIQAVDAAHQDLAPATVSYGVGQAGFAVNRRQNKEADVPRLREAGQLQGPVDHDVPVLAVHSPEGKLRGVVFGYACHATTLSFLKWCGDYPGYAMMNLEAAHPGITAMFFAGCGGDQNPLPRRTVELARNYGQQLADAVKAVLAQPMTPLPPEFQAIYREIDLPFQEIPSRDALLKDRENPNKYVANRARLLLQTLESRGAIHATYPYPVQTWRLGGRLCVVILGGEVVVDYSLRLKKELGPDLWVMAYANDVMAYIPSARVLMEGGYEGGGAMVYYGLPSAWDRRVEDLIVEETHRQVKALRSR